MWVRRSLIQVTAGNAGRLVPVTSNPRPNKGRKHGVDWVEIWTVAYVAIAVIITLYEVAARDTHGFLASVIAGSFLVPPFGRIFGWW